MNITAAHHTPGPWFATRDSRWNSVCRIGRAWDIVSKLPLSEFGHPDMDAHLISAAPDMLATLRDVDGWLENTGHDADHPWRVSIRAVMAKATGEAS